MTKNSRMIDQFTAVIRGTGECSDCDTSFELVLYEGQSTDECFAQNHPANGCWVTEQSRIPTTSSS